MGPVARAKPAVILTFDFPCLLTEWNATEMGTHTQNNEELRLLNTRFIFLWVAQISTVYRIGASNLISRPMTYENRLATPCNRNCLAFRDLRDINLGASKRQRISGRIHLVDQRPSNSTGTDRTHGIGRDNNKITTTRLVTIGV